LGENIEGRNGRRRIGWGRGRWVVIHYGDGGDGIAQEMGATLIL
jgi:hypothetical protein